MLGVSTQTLRNWATRGILRPAEVSPGGHRRYLRRDVEAFALDTFRSARQWASSMQSGDPAAAFYCPYGATFLSKLGRLPDDLGRFPELASSLPLLVAAVAEVGNNAFDPNLGNWPDVPGLFYACDLRQRCIVLADRGRGVLETLRAVRPELSDHASALRVAFTEVVTGRAPEARGNGLKFVRKVVTEHGLQLSFQSGDAIISLAGGSREPTVTRTDVFVRGCLADLRF